MDKNQQKEKKNETKSSSLNINWFPGHMSKARREIEERLKMIDIVIELVDGRAPYSSKNPMFDEIMKNKPRLVVFTKKDMSDPVRVDEWMKYYQSLGHMAISVNLKNFNEYNKIINMCKEALKEKMAKEKARGLKPRPVRAIVVGIPNVGKSTFINRLASKKVAITGNKPGVTKAQQLIRVAKDFELFDTPGVLWPKFQSEEIAFNMALIGSIKKEVLPLDDVVLYGIKYIEENYPDALSNRYHTSKINFEEEWIEKFFTEVSNHRHIKYVRGDIDYDRIIELIMNEILEASIAKITWEKAPNV